MKLHPVLLALAVAALSFRCGGGDDSAFDPASPTPAPDSDSPPGTPPTSPTHAPRESGRLW
ncbi:MAG: hypothetical protein AAFQ82_24610, partial [Myxococcota bacterium]